MCVRVCVCVEKMKQCMASGGSKATVWMGGWRRKGRKGWGGLREEERVKRRGRERERQGGSGSLSAGAGPRTRHRLARAPYLPPPTAIYYSFLTHFSPREFRSTRGRKRASNKKFCG